MSEEEGGSSVKAAVDQINESLSNAIPELVLLLVALADKNAPPPPQVPMSVEGVAAAAEVLGSVCNSVAQDEYGDYPEVQKDIMDSAAKVDSGAAELRKASDELVKSTDYAPAYKEVMDAAKAIAGSCIHVLQVVYGAFFRRAQALCGNTRAVIEDVDPCLPQNIEDLQRFADGVGDACTRASETAGRLRELADNEDSPLAKQQLNEAADKVEQAADAFIEAANEYLADPDNEEKRLAAQKAQKALLQAIDDAEQPINRLKTQLDEQNAAVQKAATARAAAAAVAPKPAPKPKEEEKPAPVARPSKASQLASPVLAANQPTDKKTLEDELRVQRDLVDDFVRQAEDGQAPQMVEDAKAILQRHPVLVQQAMDSAKGSPESQKSVQKTANRLAEELPKLIEAGKEVLGNPEDKDARKKLEERAEKVNKLLKKLEPSSLEEEERERLAKIAAEQAKRAAEEQKKREEAAARAPAAKKSRFETYRAGEAIPCPAACNSSCQDMKETLDQLVAAAPNEDEQQALADRAADVAALQPYLVQDCKKMAERVRDPKAKKDALSDVEDMNEALERVKRASKSVLESTAAKDEPARQEALKELRSAVEDAEDAIDNFENDTRAPIVALVEKALKDNDKLTTAAEKKDKDEIDDEAIALTESASGVMNSLRDEAARCPDPARKKALEKAAEDIDEALAEVLKTARDVRDGKATPEDQKRAAEKLKKALEEAERLMNPQHADEKNRPSPSHFVCTARTDPDQQSLDQAARAASALMRHNDLTAEKLENDPEAFRKEAERTADELEKIADSIKLSPEDQVAYDAQKLAKDYAALAGAVADGDEDAIEEFMLECNDDEQRLVEGIKAVASMCQSDDPEDVERRNQLEADAASIEDLHQKMAHAASAAERAKPDGDSAAEAAACARAARVVLKDVQDNTCEAADAKLAALDEAVKEDLQALREAIAKDDAEAARKAAKKLNKDVEELAKTADLIARRDAALDPERAERVKELAAAADGNAEDVRKAAKAWDKARKAGDAAGAAEAKNRCSKKADELDKNVQDISDALDAPYRAAVAQEQQTLNELANAAAVKHNPQETVAKMRELVQDQKKLHEVAKPVHADRAKQEEALQRLDQLLPQAVAASKACLQNPSAESDKNLHDVVYEMQNELLAAKAAGDSGTEKGRAEAAIVDARKGVADVKRAAAAGDAQALEAAKKSLQASIAQLDELAQDRNSAFANAKCADACEVDEALAQLKKLSADMDKAGGKAEQVAAAASQMQAPLETLEGNVDAPRSEAADTKKRIRGLAIKARKGACNLNRRNLDDLIAAGKNLAGALNGFGDSARVAAASGAGTKRSNAALALDELLRNMELGNVDVDVAQVEQLMQEAAAPEPEAPAVEEMPTFATSIAQVATEIEEAVETHKKEILSIPGLDASPLATFLKKLAEAARNNQRQDMLVSARGVSACVVAFCKELTSCAKRCKDAVYQDKMYNSIAALKNFGTQLKILTAVKAASDLDESDSDEQIINVVKSLGKTTTEALASIEIANKANLLKK